MVQIAIFCDGTWNSPYIPEPTHVDELCKACDGVVGQQVIYISGVGTGGKFWTGVGEFIFRNLSGAFGWGLNGKIKQAYRELCKVYKDGDKILIFGFSRGAYTARSLVGMIRKCGIVDDPTDQNVDAAFRLYRKRGEDYRPDAARALKERRALSPDFATSEADLRWRGDNSSLVKIAYLGVWDSVGALGLPEPILGFLASLWNRRYRFHDVKLSSSVESARHAVALDERRSLFEPDLWDNLDANDEGPGLNNGDTSENRPYQQVWFVGDHSIVGGSAGRSQGLSAITLLWIWEGAKKHGLKHHAGYNLPKADATLKTTEIYDNKEIDKLFKNTLLKWRGGPTQQRDLHPSVAQRVKNMPYYLPDSLMRLGLRLSLNGPLGGQGTESD